MNQWINEQTSLASILTLTNELSIIITVLWMNEWILEMDEWMNEWTSSASILIIKYTVYDYDTTVNWMNKWVNEWMNKWMNAGSLTV